MEKSIANKIKKTPNSNPMDETIILGSIKVNILRKKIKNIYLKVHPPEGNVSISAPLQMQREIIHNFALSKLQWIKKQQKKIQSQTREIPHQYIDKELHYLWGKKYQLKIIESYKSPQIQLKDNHLLLQISPTTSFAEKKAIVSYWYRRQLREAIPPIIAKWQPVMGVKVNKFFIQQMKTKWGSCNVTLGNIRLNLELAKKPPQCLEYVVVHEITHLLEASHNHCFNSLMDQFMPQWRDNKKTLNT